MTDVDKKPRILIVDDVPINIKSLASVLDRDYEIAVASSGQKALKSISKKHPDIILLDIVMLEIDGFEVCKFLKSNETTRDIPVIFVSGKNEQEEKIMGEALGAVGFLTKPIDTSVLIPLLRTHLKTEIQ